jgi:Asp-tRNA(Asn)/Glu-tRNA(Gln) amidotransferase A subunit family amidase
MLREVRRRHNACWKSAARLAGGGAPGTRSLYNTFLGNLFRMCGLALPSGTDAAGLPTGVQFLALSGNDDRLLSIGLSIESALSS